MNTNQLNYLVTLANEKNYTRAAAKLYITQPTLSQQIKQMEQEVGQQLFIRSNRSIELTAAGKILYQYANETLQGWQKCQSQLINTSPSMVGSLKVGLFWTFGYNHIDEILSNFRNTYPNIDLQLSIDGSAVLLDKLITNQLDCAFITGCYLPNDNEFIFLKKTIDFILLMQSPLMCMAHENSPLALKSSVSFEDFDNQPIMHVSQLSNMYHIFKQCLNDSGAKPRIIGYSSQADINMQVASSNIGYSFMTLDTYKAIKPAHVKAVPLIPQLNRQVFLVCNKKNSNNAIELIKNII